ncbi:unnamed protein product [Vitrella brassicaformis CCMP3155]|uniref:AB hydrolase-1 domain-containing protein n=2 Tax=Vitrella brassicaformis TaxID=1169539 RepID=A0A0G4FTY7_VITBC|nr:unnamed protein product [Vitrella brassicaformis CCMP3155]|mmetsp:Transcript_46544/g.115892  ORF Transcript_46544/g.115892 Transcript_46544/m.115892 type:complete len:343 (+) Transcript_46544:639-1667(+)|eukprot:CEM18370.1 unnamed protein product [Vitrella brassicaformis CCMP3155]
MLFVALSIAASLVPLARSYQLASGAAALPPVKSNVKLFQCSDGRNIGYAEYGSPAGQPVVAFHGLLTSHIWAEFLDQEARNADPPLRIISVDMPGAGDSSPSPDFTLDELAKDTIALLDSLNIDTFVALGLSAGGSPALTLAALYPDRTIGAVLAAPSTPIRSVRGFGLLPTILLQFDRFLSKAADTFSRNADQVREGNVEELLGGAPKGGRGGDAKEETPALVKVRGDPALKALFVDDICYSFKQRRAFAMAGLKYLRGRFPFKVRCVRRPVTIIYGTNDTVQPIKMHKWLAKKLPNCKLIAIDDETHFLYISRPDAIVRECSLLWQMATEKKQETPTQVA